MSLAQLSLLRNRAGVDDIAEAVLCDRRCPRDGAYGVGLSTCEDDSGILGESVLEDRGLEGIGSRLGVLGLSGAIERGEAKLAGWRLDRVALPA